MLLFCQEASNDSLAKNILVITTYQLTSWIALPLIYIYFKLTNTGSSDHSFYSILLLLPMCLADWASAPDVFDLTLKWSKYSIWWKLGLNSLSSSFIYVYFRIGSKHIWCERHFFKAINWCISMNGVLVDLSTYELESVCC